MRVLVFGHSDTAGVALRAHAQAWPRLLEGHLQRVMPGDAEVIHRRLNILRPGPLEYMDAELEMHRPDVAVLALTSVTFSLPLVSVAVRRRFGARVARRYLHLEGWVAGSLTSTTGGREGQGVGRWVARRLLGSATHLALPAATEIHIELLRRLSMHEGLRVIVISASLLSGPFQRREPWARPQIEAFNRALQEAAAHHRLEWVDFEALLARSGDHAACYGPDGVHKSALGHRHIAEELAGVIAPRPAAW